MTRAISLKTPENVTVDFALASPGARLIAFGVDVGVVLVLSGMIWAGVSLAAAIFSIPASISGAINGTLGFLLRSFYFAWTELRFHGRTPGKRIVNTRVIARDGGPLTGGQVVARNLTRELELFLPFLVLVMNDSLLPHAPTWVWFASASWALLLLFFPLLHKDRSRVGDLLAGTVVVQGPRARLLPDLARKKVRAHTFTKAQLDLYGIRELTVLEEVLRRPYPERELLRQITERIVQKIGWEAPVTNYHAFLEDFYAAQRAQLENKLLMGERREEKVR